MTVIPRAAVEAVADRLTYLGLAQGAVAFATAQDLLYLLIPSGYTVVPATCAETTPGLLGNRTGPSNRHYCVLGPQIGRAHV